MRDIDIFEGLRILLGYRKPKCIAAQHEEIWFGTTEVPLNEEDYNDMIKFGFTPCGCYIEDKKEEYPSYQDYINDNGDTEWHCYT